MKYDMKMLTFTSFSTVWILCSIWLFALIVDYKTVYDIRIGIFRSLAPPLSYLKIFVVVTTVTLRCSQLPDSDFNAVDVFHDGIKYGEIQKKKKKTVFSRLLINHKLLCLEGNIILSVVITRPSLSPFADLYIERRNIILCTHCIDRISRNRWTFLPRVPRKRFSLSAAINFSLLRQLSYLRLGTKSRKNHSAIHEPWQYCISRRVNRKHYYIRHCVWRATIKCMVITSKIT